MEDAEEGLGHVGGEGERDFAGLRDFDIDCAVVDEQVLIGLGAVWGSDDEGDERALRVIEPVVVTGAICEECGCASVYGHD